MARVELIQVRKSYPNGTKAVDDLDLSIASGEFLCILGPSGCGKSSTLRMVAGLEEVTSGEIRIDGHDVVNTPSRDRDIAMVFENYALYPHLTVFDNIAMPLAARRTPKPELKARVAAIAETLGITTHLGVRPKQLSGGQRQRVALARAMVRRPRMFLMDEPLGHLEAYLRVELRREIRRLHEDIGGTTLYITHDQQEAAAISDRVAVMSGGVLQQVGTISELIDRPANRFVAEFVGEPPINMMDGVTWDGSALHVAGAVLAPPEPLARALGRSARKDVAVGIRPDALAFAEPQGGTGGIPCAVESLQPMGEWAAVLCRSDVGILTVVAPTDLAPKEGANVAVVPDPTRLQAFGSDGRNVLAEGGGRHG